MHALCLSVSSLCSPLRPTDEAIERAQCVSEAGGFARDSELIPVGFGTGSEALGCGGAAEIKGKQQKWPRSDLLPERCSRGNLALI